MKLKTFDEAVKYLYTQIPQSSQVHLRGEVWLKRSSTFMKLLDDPQESLKVIHIAGTSGKGSTAYLTSSLLLSQGFKVGLALSPHLLDIRERLEINNSLISEKEFVENLNQIIPAIEKARNGEFGCPTFFEVMVGLAFYIFKKAKVDYAVMETGLGGTYDATNTVSSPDKLCLITKIGFDHTKILGKTLKQIATNKAGIIHPGNQVFTITQAPSARQVFEHRAKDQGASLTILKLNENYKNISVDQDYTTLDFQLGSIKLNKLQLGLKGSYQAENTSLALAALITLGDRDSFDIQWDKVRETLRNIKFLGRFDIKRFQDKQLLIDGAHNPQKMQSFLKNVTALFPNQKFIFLVAFKHSKDYASMLRQMMPLAEKIIVSSFQSSNLELTHTAAEFQTIEKIFQREGFKNYQFLANNKEALNASLKEKPQHVVVTGSLYFISEIYPLLHQEA